MIRRIIVVLCLLAALAVLLVGVADCFTYLSFTFGTPQQLPVVIIEYSRGYCSVWYITTARKPIPTRSSEMFVWWFVGGQKVIAPLMWYEKQENNMFTQYVIRSADKNYRYVPSAGVINNGVATAVKIGLWIPFLILLTYPAIAFIRGPYRRYMRREKGLCLKCGYNLTGNVSGICPECGEKI